MDELISFSLVPSSFRECYVVDNLKINRLLVGFSGEKEYNRHFNLTDNRRELCNGSVMHAV